MPHRCMRGVHVLLCRRLGHHVSTSASVPTAASPSSARTTSSCLRRTSVRGPSFRRSRCVMHRQRRVASASALLLCCGVALSLLLVDGPLVFGMAPLPSRPPSHLFSQSLLLAFLLQVRHDALCEAALSVGSELAGLGVIGAVTVDFVVHVVRRMPGAVFVLSPHADSVVYIFVCVRCRRLGMTRVGCGLWISS
jgi:hypothetical protein